MTTQQDYEYELDLDDYDDDDKNIYYKQLADLKVDPHTVEVCRQALNLVGHIILIKI